MSTSPSTDTVILFHVTATATFRPDGTPGVEDQRSREGGKPLEIPMDGTSTDENFFGEPFYEVGVTCTECEMYLPNAVRVYPETTLRPWRWRRSWLLLVPIIGWRMLFDIGGSRQKAHLGEFRHWASDWEAVDGEVVRVYHRFNNPWG